MGYHIMDFQICAIVCIFVFLFILEQFEDKENFEKYPFPEVLNQPDNADYQPSVNMGASGRNFGNFGTIGITPPFPLANSCDLGYNKVTAPYYHANDLGDQPQDNNMKLGRNCLDTFGKNYGDLNKPYLVKARSAGRVRQTRRLL